MTKNKTVLLCKFSRGLRTHDYLQRRNTEYINNINISKKKKWIKYKKKNSNKKGMSSLHPNHTSVIRFPLNTTLKTEIQFSGTRTRGIGRLLDSDESNLSKFQFHFRVSCDSVAYLIFYFPFQKRHGVNWNCQKHRPIWNTGNWIITNKYGVVDVTLWELFLMVAFDMGDVSSQDYDGDF